MHIGKLRHRITLQQPFETQNDYGAFVTTWQDVSTVWAEIKPISGREYFSAQQVQSEVSTQIWIRYRKGIVPTMRIEHNGKHYEIISVLNYQGLNKALQLMCKEIAYG
ncbi:head-tail adaptor protein [Pasteurellaceae bacterium Macca]|nr:head-tail adaptor protein [Pasteurellaceae bacterium Macca]MCK3656439.1 head-tail adaptor protein [Pasteurellaceae bacterium Macca]MCK3656734.1 head-tail adaptor protein [Pasteurellaceae bacterium Macca]MCK3657092.1 head-tail adaptor protein [Pasteurellaceae bacterium Macca]